MLRQLFDSLRLRARGSTGRRGEQIAANHLKKHGYRILATNVKSRLGEVDIVACDPDGKTIVIVEVKAAASSQPGLPPEVHVTAQKQHKLTQLASMLARQHQWQDRPIRFDVIAVEAAGDREPIIRHHQGAFEATF